MLPVDHKPFIERRPPGQLTIDEAAARLGVSREYVYQQIKDGKLAVSTAAGPSKRKWIGEAVLARFARRYGRGLQNS